MHVYSNILLFALCVSWFASFDNNLISTTIIVEGPLNGIDQGRVVILLGCNTKNGIYHDKHDIEAQDAASEKERAGEYE